MEDKRCKKCGRVYMETDKEKCDCGHKLEKFNWIKDKKEFTPCQGNLKR